MLLLPATRAQSIHAYMTKNKPGISKETKTTTATITITEHTFKI